MIQGLGALGFLTCILGMGLRVFRAGTLDKPKEHQSLEIYNCRMGEQLRSPSKDCEVLRKQVANSLTSGIALTR